MIEGSTALILAGGKSRRFGSPKALAPWRGAPLIESVAAVLRPVFPEILIVTRAPEDYAFLRAPQLRIIRDRIPESHALGGLYSGLSFIRNDSAFVCACDMPLIQPSLVRLLWEAQRGYDAAAPQWKGTLQPLCAVYSKGCLAVLSQMIRKEKIFKLQALFARVRARTVSEELVRTADPPGLSFQDIDTPSDYLRLSQL